MSNENDYEAVIREADAFLKEHPITKESFTIWLYKAWAHNKLYQEEDAILAFEKSISYIKQYNNVLQRKYSYVYFNLGKLYHRKGNHKTAIGYLHEGLVLDPNNTYHQILLGAAYEQSGEGERALSHFRELLDSPMIKEEEKVVIKIKMDRLGKTDPDADFKPTYWNDRPFYYQMGIRILPINDYDEQINLQDLCVFMESKFLAGCEVWPTQMLDEKEILDKERNQYSGQKILAELNKIYPLSSRPDYFILAVTGKDIFRE